MKKSLLIPTLFVLPLLSLSLLLLLPTPAAHSAPAPVSDVETVEPAVPTEACEGENLLQNPSFEGAYSPYIPPEWNPDCPWGICFSAMMAPDWTPWWVSRDPNDPGDTNVMPEYKQATLGIPGPVRVYEGEAAQQYFTFWRTHKAGFYQQVAAVPGQSYCLSLWGHSWSADDDDDYLSGPEYGVLTQTIGLDPTGGTDWQNPAIVWSPAREQYDVYGLFQVQAEAQASTITVFVLSAPQWAVKHNDVYWDDAHLSVMAGMDVTPAGGLLFLADVDQPQSSSQSVQVDFTDGYSLTWTAALEAGRTFTPLFSPTSGGDGESLTVTADSNGLPIGVYEATITITASEDNVLGSPAALPVQLLVVPEVYEFYLPVVRH
ncbi:MAG: hypothetical protein AB1791_22935 [Chloroflexota bacterium]